MDPSCLSSSTQCCAHYRFCRCVSHRTHICPQPWMGSTAEPKLQPIHGALGGFLWSQVSFLISQHSGGLCWPWALCRVHLGPHTSDRAVPAPGLLAPLVLTTYCPSKHSCNIPFLSARVSCAFIWQFWGTLHLPVEAFALFFHPGCGCCAQVWTAKGHQVPGRQGRCLTGSH